jgi:hypothetical protein
MSNGRIIRVFGSLAARATLIGVFGLPACGADVFQSPPGGATAHSRAASALLAEIEARIAVQRPPGTNEPAQLKAMWAGNDDAAKSPFGSHEQRAFVVDAAGALSLAEPTSEKEPGEPGPSDRVGTKPEEVAALDALSSRASGGTRAVASFPVTAASGLRVSVAGRPDAWLKMRPRRASHSERSVVEGLVIYPGMVAGADAIYAVSEGHIEEFLNIHDAAQAKGLEFDLELGDGITSFRVDGSGAGLEALGRGDEVVLRAPMPEGVDATGRAVRGHLSAERLDDHRYTIHVTLDVDEEGLAFPVLLDPSWVGTGASGARYYTAAALLTSGQVLLAGGASMGFSGAISYAELYDPSTGTFSATGPLLTARRLHTATLLASGKVLIAGGDNGTLHNIVSIAELYDPATGTFSATGSLVTGREVHTATLLASGKVLFAGGLSRSTSAELYDPTSGTFSATGSLVNGRDGHTATLLPSGKVLVAGGETAASNAELYDPASGTFSATGPLAAIRAFHTATLLPSGKVLIAAGQSQQGTGGFLASAELYNPATGTFSATGSLITPRDSFTATLLPSGKVLIAAGRTLVGSTVTPLASAELYDPTTGTFSATASLASARDYFTATLLPSGRVLVAGNGEGPGSGAELYDPAAGTFSATGSLTTARYQHTATLMASGRTLVAGGYNGSVALAGAELYDPATGTFAATGSLAAGRYQHTVTLLPSGKALVAGGNNGSHALLGVELYDPAAGIFTTTGSLATARSQHTATLLPSGKVLVAGGSNGGLAIAGAELYAPGTGTFAATGSLTTMRSQHTATLLASGKVLVAGGFNGSLALASAELYDPAAGTFSTVGALANGRYGHTATLLASGKVLIAGGQAAGGTLASAELFDPTTGTFSVTGSLATGRFGHTATLLASGKVLVAGSDVSGGGLPLASAELYDPVAGTFSAAGSLASARASHTATLLASGRVLVAGGSGGPGAPLDVGELYDEGFGFPDSLRPTISSINGTPVAGATIMISGGQLRGAGEGSSGSTNSSATNYPLVRLMRDGNEQLLYARTSDASGAWSNTSTTLRAVLPAGMLPGLWRFQVVTSAIPSTGVPLLNCDDANSCTADSYNSGAGVCVHTIITGCSVPVPALGRYTTLLMSLFLLIGVGAVRGWLWTRAGNMLPRRDRHPPAP